MDDELRKRREETWEMLIVKGYEYSRVVSTLADRYDCDEQAIKSDIRRMDKWINKLDRFTDTDATSRLKEIRRNRQRLHQMATEARSQEDIGLELSIRRRIDKAVELDVELSQSVGKTDREADKLEVDVDPAEAYRKALREKNKMNQEEEK